MTGQTKPLIESSTSWKEKHNSGLEVIEITDDILLKKNTLKELKTRLLANPKLYNKKGEINSNLYKMLSARDASILNVYLPRPSFNETIYCLLNDIYEYPLCAQCLTKSVTFYYNSKKGYSKFCSLQCSRKHDDSKSKRTNTNLKKYGVRNPKQSPLIIEKIKNNNLSKYGVTNPTQLDSVKQKISQTLIENYRENKSEILDKKNSTFLSRYGDHPNRLEDVKNKKKQSTLEKYGVEHTTQFPKFKEKIKNSLIDRYGVPSFFKTPEMQRLSQLKNQQKTQESVQQFLEKIKNIDTQEYTIKELSELTCLSYTTILNKVKSLKLPFKIGSQQQISEVEQEIKNYVSGLGIKNIVSNDRSILSGQELDIYLPDYNIAIEVNGVYWHSELYGRDHTYHLGKTVKCQQNNIQLLHIFDTEWHDEVKQQIWKSMIRSRLGLNHRIFARQCRIDYVDSSLAREFCEMYHLQGYVNGSIRLGLFYDDQLVQLIVLGKPRYSQKTQLELLRSATMIGVNVIGGLSKLLSYIPQSIISYADRRYSTGKSYEKCGFQLVETAKPNYFYLVEGELQSRIKYQKHKLANLLENYDPSKSEVDNMHNNNYYRVWDCGNYIFIRSAISQR